MLGAKAPDCHPALRVKGCAPAWDLRPISYQGPVCGVRLVHRPVIREFRGAHRFYHHFDECCLPLFGGTDGTAGMQE